MAQQTQRIFGSTGKSIPVIGQGTWKMESDRRADAIAAIRRGIDLGLTHIDTAELYGSGRVEELLSEALEGQRDKLYLVSKVLPSNASRKGTITACERSLKKLKTDRLDCYLLHWPGNYKLEETFAALEQLHSEGKILSWGVSNFDVGELDSALRIAGPNKIACNQVLYHLGERAIEHAVIPWCEAHNVAVVAYSPFGAGNFPSSSSAGGKILSEIAAQHKATPYQVALAFLTHRPSVFAIPKAASVAHVTDNAGASALKLSADDIAHIDKAFPRGRRGHLPML